MRLFHNFASNTRASRRAQTGAGSIEFVVMAMPLLFLAFGAFEAARWMAERQVVGLALHEAGRAGIVSHASPQAMHTAFEHTVQTLFASPAPAGALRRLRQFQHHLSTSAGVPPWQIEIHSPTAAAFRDFSQAVAPMPATSPHLPMHTPRINNHYLAEQASHYRRLGLPEGRGTESGMSIVDANTLALRLRYAYAPLAPGLKSLLRTLAEATDHPYSQQVFRQGYLPIRRDMAMMMQSHPGLWALPGNGYFTRPVTPYPLARPVSKQPERRFQSHGLPQELPGHP